MLVPCENEFCSVKVLVGPNDPPHRCQYCARGERVARHMPLRRARLKEARFGRANWGREEDL